MRSLSPSLSRSLSHSLFGRLISVDPSYRLDMAIQTVGAVGGARGLYRRIGFGNSIKTSYRLH